jgi:hypothetical protein
MVINETEKLLHLPGGLLLRVGFDPEPANPLQADDPAGRAYCWHRRYDLGHQPNPYAHPSDLYEALFEQFGVKNVPELKAKGTVIVPLYLYDHSGLAMSTYEYSDPWDSGQAGVWVVLPDEVQAEFGGDRDKARAYVEAAVAEYSEYLGGQVYCYEILDALGDVKRRGENFYGSNFVANGLYQDAGYDPAFPASS